jgi:glutaminase
MTIALKESAAPVHERHASPLREELVEIHRRLSALDEGATATYIPELAKVDPSLYGIAIATLDGHVDQVGDADAPFTIQSVSKPFVYGMALEDRGLPAVMARIGVEPSGDAFNSIMMDEQRNRPFNPMVNAGAIATTSLIAGDGHARRLARIIDTFGRYAGRPLEIDQAVYLSEKRTGHRNRAIACLELNSGMIEEPIDDHLDLYFRQCSLRVTARDLAVMAATLANRGVNPITGARALAPEYVRNVLSVMSSCGMYDWSGEWLFRVGLPAKSGVGGGILAVLPGQVGIGVFSPLLDGHGNSVRGVRTCEMLAEQFGLHLFDSQSTSGRAVRRRYDGSAVRSRRARDAESRATLKREGRQIAVCELQGDLFLADIEQLIRSLETGASRPRFVVLDGRRVGRADRGAIAMLARLPSLMNSFRSEFVMAGFSPLLSAAIRNDPASKGSTAKAFDDTDSALEWCEDRLLGRAASAGRIEISITVPLERMDVLRDLDASDRQRIGAMLVTSHYEAGDSIVREGDAADRLFFLAAGSATARMDVAQGSKIRRLRGYAAGVAFGEPALFGAPYRTADVVADTDVICHALTLKALDTLAREAPQVHARLLTSVGKNLVELLSHATQEIRALEA